MEFNSFAFLYFFVVVFSAYAVLKHRWQNWLLLGASYFFYGFWDARFLALIIISTLIDFECSRRMPAATPGRRKFLLLVSVAANLGILGFFKYFNFFIDSFAVLAETFGWSVRAFHLELILPVGISFYTFQTMSYTIDVWRGKIQPCRRLDDFALYVCFFPQLVAGPIERASALLPQIAARRTVDYQKLAEGAWFVLLGFFKKVVVADNLAFYVEKYRTDSAMLSGGELAVGFYIMVLFLYADFSGYSNIARGCARLLGFEISQNFRMPLFATNPADFWRRWHITLSDWFRDYCFQPMVSAFRKQHRRPSVIGACAFATLVLCGLWHGAAWNFIVFGSLHGLLLVGYYALRPVLRRPSVRSFFGRGLGYLCNRLVVFHLLCLPVVFFIIPWANDWRVYFRGILFGAWDRAAVEPLLTLVIFGTPLIVIDLVQEYRQDIFAVRALKRPVRTFVYGLLFSMIVLAGATSTHEFVYFQF
jgi:D-alanyl-lipoteichoic acid acyltransferase DltB (MBOAT superfamily)